MGWIPYNIEENGVAERTNRTIMDDMRPVLSSAQLDHRYWEYDYCDAFLKHNLLTHGATDQLKYIEWTGFS